MQIKYGQVLKHNGNLILDIIHFQLGANIGKDLTDNNEDTIVDSMHDTIGRFSRSLVLLHCFKIAKCQITGAVEVALSASTFFGYIVYEGYKSEPTT
jgi:hypothetical protein